METIEDGSEPSFENTEEIEYGTWKGDRSRVRGGKNIKTKASRKNVKENQPSNTDKHFTTSEASEIRSSSKIFERKKLKTHKKKKIFDDEDLNLMEDDNKFQKGSFSREDKGKKNSYREGKKNQRKSFKNHQKDISTETKEQPSQTDDKEPYRYHQRKKKKPLIPEIHLQIVPKHQWDPSAEKINDLDIFCTPVNHIDYTHTNTETCNNRAECVGILKKLQARAQAAGRLDIAYNFLVGGDNCVYEGRGWNLRPNFLLGENVDHSLATIPRSISIAFIGRFRVSNPPPDMMSAAYHFVNIGLKRKFILRRFRYTRFKDRM